MRINFQCFQLQRNKFIIVAIPIRSQNSASEGMHFKIVTMFWIKRMLKYLIGYPERFLYIILM